MTELSINRGLIQINVNELHFFRMTNTYTSMNMFIFDKKQLSILTVSLFLTYQHKYLPI